MRKKAALFVIGIFGLGTIVSSLLPVPTVHAACTQTVTNTNDSGGGSLRQAITNANISIDFDEICFSISSGLQTIIPTSPLPVIIQPVLIDGTTQSGFSGSPIIEVSGNGAGSNAIGLRITGNGDGSTIRGLVINKFSAQGIFIDTNGVTVRGNYIGTNALGTAAAGNGGDGVAVYSGTSLATATNNIIGGATVADRNVISGNTQNGVAITAEFVSGQPGAGYSSDNIIEGNYIGTNATGTGAIGNGGDGILINDATSNSTAQSNRIGGTTSVSIGGSCTGSCNLVSGNGANGIGLWHPGVHGSIVEGNYVGVNVAGTSKIPNGNIGIEVNESPNNTVGGTSPEKRNVFSGNGGSGVFITGAASTGNVILGNYIGTNSAGTVGLGNTKMGIGVGFSPGAIGANSNTIGGTTGTTPGIGCAGACNLISGNGENGILLIGGESFGHVIVGNYIGLNAAGSNAIGNIGDGIGLLHTPNTSIGNGTNEGRNIIGSNGSNGVIIAGGGATGNRIEKNTIGLYPFGNTKSGVVISGATDTAILSNSIYFNGLLGIDLDNNGTIQLNDAGDWDSGANRLQNYPEVFASLNLNGTTYISGQFSGAPSGQYLIEFFASDGCNAGKPVNYGEGQEYVGSLNIITDIYGNTAYSFSPSSMVAGNRYITATVTKKIGGLPAETSEFSRCALINTSKPALTNGASWLLKHDLTPGSADIVFGYGFPSTFLMCAWDSHQLGVKLPVIVAGNTWFMRASYTTGAADLTFTYNSSYGYIPVCGDWDGDGVDTPGYVTPEKFWRLRNSNSSGEPDLIFQFGPYNSVPVPGDWNGDGIDTPGLATSDQTFYLRNSNSSGAADAGTFQFGYIPGYPIAGDWDGNGYDTVGSVSPTGLWALRNSLSSGPADGTFQFWFNGSTPLSLH